MRTIMHFLYMLVVRPIWFWLTRQDAERAHDQGMAILRFIGRHAPLARLLHRWLAVEDVRLTCDIAGIN
jgi:hypothetical protein